MEWEKIEGGGDITFRNSASFKIDEEIAGVLLEIKTKEFKDNTGHTYIIDVNGEKFGINASKGLVQEMNTAFSSGRLSVGGHVRLVYRGQKKLEGRPQPMHVWEVFCPKVAGSSEFEDFFGDTEEDDPFADAPGSPPPPKEQTDTDLYDMLARHASAVGISADYLQKYLKAIGVKVDFIGKGEAVSGMTEDVMLKAISGIDQVWDELTKKLGKDIKPADITASALNAAFKTVVSKLKVPA